MVSLTVETFILQQLSLGLVQAIRVTWGEHDNVIGLAIGLRTVEKDDLEVANIEDED